MYLGKPLHHKRLYISGQYDSVIKANTYLEQYVLKKLHTEIEEQMEKNELARSDTIAQEGLCFENLQVNCALKICQ